MSSNKMNAAKMKASGHKPSEIPHCLIQRLARLMLAGWPAVGAGIAKGKQAIRLNAFRQGQRLLYLCLLYTS